MKILITGGAGFIGSNLCDYLVRHDHTVLVLDDLSTGHKENLSSVMSNITFYKEKIDTFDFECIDDIDAIVHLAAQPSVPISITDFGSSSTANMCGTIKVIDFCRINQIPLLYASSSAIYGNLELGNDFSSQVDLLSPYATDKYVLELYANTAFKIYQQSSIGLRFFNVYGPRQDPNSPYSGVISIFIDRILRGDNITINGGFQTRDFVFVKDAVDLIYKAIVVASNDVCCEQTNVLTGHSISIDYLATMLINKIGGDIDKNYQALPVGDPVLSIGTTEKMVSLLNVELIDMIPIESGISKTVDFIRRQALNQ